jgi:hypothetical protein
MRVYAQGMIAETVVIGARPAGLAVATLVQPAVVVVGLD